MSFTPDIDLAAIPLEQRGAVAALVREVAELKDINKRLEHLVAELNHAVHGKRSEKLSEDERQLAFEDLETATSEVEARKKTSAFSERAKKRTKPAARRNIGNLPDHLPRIE